LIDGFEEGTSVGFKDFFSESLVGKEVTGFLVGDDVGSVVGLLEVGLTVG